ncbi:acyl carrier protein [Nostocaceae cyanobacterium CENA369]|uniref:Acyl carrier protein n=1 Tax=Dendronalium phyllosphericum CENA369 TaxID=1725256 RepID=A0A8J7IG60_9NOST|nr:acyl carrier protein [Dendronalium phyllosphericum]MBH8577220.1 acyl carrier protein [Dendronalium phyllosphericum CENA369]
MKTQQQISQWIKIYLAEILEVEPEQVDENYEFERFGLNSSAAVSLVGDLEEWLGFELSPSLFFEFNTIAQVSTYLAEMAQEENTLENVA